MHIAHMRCTKVSCAHSMLVTFVCTLVITIHVLLSIAAVNEYQMFNIHAGLISYDCTEDNGDNDDDDYGGDDDSEGAF